MQIVLISGSANLDSQTSQALDALLEGIRAGGADGETLLLARFDITRCRHCDRQGDSPCQRQGRCLTEDDFESVVMRIRRADAVAFATPVYFGGPSAVLRAFFHRLGNICAHPNARKGIAGTPAVGLCVGGGAANCAEKLKRILSACGFDVVEAIPAPRRELHLKLAMVKAAGERLAAALPARGPG